jgi:hypothetical protein
VRNIGPWDEASPADSQSANAAESADTWFTIRSAITSRSAARAATSSHVPMRGSTEVWSIGSNPASAPSIGTKKGRR